MSDPGSRVDGPVLDQAYDPREIAGQGVARSQQVHFLAVEGGMDEGDFLGRYADVDEGSGMSDVSEGAGHRVWVAGGIGNEVKEVAVGDFPAFFERNVINLDKTSLLVKSNPPSNLSTTEYLTQLLHCPFT